jgi:hypothetical protein
VTNLRRLLGLGPPETDRGGGGTDTEQEIEAWLAAHRGGFPQTEEARSLLQALLAGLLERGVWTPACSKLVNALGSDELRTKYNRLWLRCMLEVRHPLTGLRGAVRSAARR